uniref:Homing endonuclease LAGLIDADG domain-containing protein n=1 Tax=Dactylella sp. TaxID=1814903 RepID=A0A482DTI3_9PEZI|nr:hypothetical protein [Dactylella sp.]
MSTNSLVVNKSELGSYLAGLIESDGSIIVPKDSINTPTIKIVFNIKDKPLADYLMKTLGSGSIHTSSDNSVIYAVRSKLGIIKIVNLINGEFKIPKIGALHRLIDWINANPNYNNSVAINKLPLNTAPLGTNSWFSGFSEGDGSFNIRVTEGAKYNDISVTFLKINKKSPIFIINNKNKLVHRLSAVIQNYFSGVFRFSSCVYIIYLFYLAIWFITYLSCLFLDNFFLDIPYFSHVFSLTLALLPIKVVGNKNVKPGENLSLAYISGFSDGESSFTISIEANKGIKTGWEVKPSFSIHLHIKDLALLLRIQSVLGVGNIAKNKDGSCTYYVRSLKDLINVIIPHFDKYPLITQKRADFELFKKVVELKNQKKHLTIEGIHEIVSIKASINWGLSEKLKSKFDSFAIKPVARPLILIPDIINSHWFSGFTDGEGSFVVLIQDFQTIKRSPQVKLVFTITQHLRDKELMKSIIKFLNCGNCYEKVNMGKNSHVQITN